MPSDLMKMDLIGDSDPFCNLSVGCQHWQSSVNLTHQIVYGKKTKQATEIKCPSITFYIVSQVVKRTVEPVWKEDWDVVVEEAMDQRLDLDMWDKDHVGADEFMGRASFPLSKLTDNGKTDQWVRILK